MNGAIIAGILVVGALLVVLLLRPAQQPARPDPAQQMGAGVGQLLSGILAAAGVGGGS